MAEDQPLRSGLLAPLLLALAGLAGVLLLLTRERARPDPRVPACRASASAAWDAFVKDDFALARDRLATLDRDCNGALGDDNARLRKALDAKAALSVERLADAASAAAVATAEAAAEARRATSRERWKTPAWLATALRATTAPSSVPAVKVYPPGSEEHTTYEYALPGAGTVLLWFVDAERWSLFFDKAGPVSVNDLTPEGWLLRLYTAGPVTAHRILAGPLSGHFLFELPGGLEVRSQKQTCHGSPGLEALRRACR